VIVLALSSWLGKVWANRILEQDRRRYAEELERVKTELERTSREWQAQLDKAVHVHRVQFETEFKALSDLWASLSRVRAAFGAVRPIASIGPMEETKEQKIAALFERLKPLIEAYNRARQILDDLSPFYPQAIYQAADAALRTTNSEIANVKIDHEPFRSEWWDRGEKNHNQFLDKWTWCRCGFARDSLHWRSLAASNQDLRDQTGRGVLQPNLLPHLLGDPRQSASSRAQQGSYDARDLVLDRTGLSLRGSDVARGGTTRRLRRPNARHVRAGDRRGA
jgi:hypothetical protein